MAKKKKTIIKPIIIRDTREKDGHGWTFDNLEKSFWGGTITEGLKTGDYSIQGLEKIICIERKESAAEFFGNLFCTWETFEKELERLRKFPVAAIILEFGIEDVINWKRVCEIPNKTKNAIHQYAYLARITETQIAYPNIQIVFAGKYGKEIAGSLLKRGFEQYGKVQYSN